jgi:DNA transformation protein
MFGGYGIYHDSVMFGLVADDVLYLKADETSSASFMQRGLSAFEYEKAGKSIRMSYYGAPEETFDAPERATQWATLAFDAALRAKKSKVKTKRKRVKSGGPMAAGSEAG